jgi:hypothetical protein
MFHHGSHAARQAHNLMAKIQLLEHGQLLALLRPSGGYRETTAVTG